MVKWWWCAWARAAVIWAGCVCVCVSPRSQTALNNGFTAIGGRGWALWKIHLTTGAGRHGPSQPRTTSVLPGGEVAALRPLFQCSWHSSVVFLVKLLKQKPKRNLFSYRRSYSDCILSVSANMSTLLRSLLKHCCLFASVTLWFRWQYWFWNSKMWFGWTTLFLFCPF